MTIRLAQQAELHAIMAVVQRAYAPYIPRIGRRPAPMDDDYKARIHRQQVHLALDGDILLGLIVLIDSGDHLLVENVAVTPTMQRQGTGRALMAHADAVAQQRRLPEIRLYTNAAMTENLSFYARLGYRETGRAEQSGFDRVFFTKSTRAVLRAS